MYIVCICKRNKNYILKILKDVFLLSFLNSRKILIINIFFIIVFLFNNVGCIVGLLD